MQTCTAHIKAAHRPCRARVPLCVPHEGDFCLLLMTAETGLTHVVSRDGSCMLANTKASSLQNGLTTAWELLVCSFLQESTARLNWLQASLCANWNQAKPRSVNAVMGEFLYKLTMENCWLFSACKSLHVCACVCICVGVGRGSPDVLHNVHCS